MDFSEPVVQRSSIKKVFLTNLENFTGKHLCLRFGIIKCKTYQRISVAVQWNDFKIFFALSSSFQYTILLEKLWQPWKLLEYSYTSTLASYKLVSYEKECIVQYAIKKLMKYSLKKQKKKLSLSYVLLISFIKKICRIVSK